MSKGHKKLPLNIKCHSRKQSLSIVDDTGDQTEKS